MTDTNTAEREAIIRAAVAAMPHTNPLVADDLLGGFTMHTEADDIVAIFQAGRASLAASAGSEPMFWVRLFRDGLYEGPVHHKSVVGKMLRDEKPGEWTPLYTHHSPPEGMAGWKPIETAPKDGTEILLRSARGRVADGAWGQPDGWANPNCWVWPYINQEPTHWMPLPASEAKEL